VPQRIPPEELFERDQVERARRYNRPAYLAFLINAATGLAVLAALAFGGLSFEGLPWWAAAIVLAVLAVTCPLLARLPVGYWFGYLRERGWDFSTQTARGWLADRAKGLVVGLALTVPVMVGLVALGRALPDVWPLPAAIAGGLFVLVIGYVAPVVIEPLFNRFERLADEELVGALLALGDRAGTPVRDVLVADASRRTRKVNAYVSGLGSTRRVVLFDTLLEKSERPEIELVVAHELGHRRFGHVLKGTLLGIAGVIGLVLVAWAAVGTPQPADIPLILLIAAGLELLALPAGAALSRRWERAADAFSLGLTGDPSAFERTHRDLAVANLSDLDPPRLVYLAIFSHPTPPERIAFGRRWAERYGSAA
jgi:STE24 endopeptidase